MNLIRKKIFGFYVALLVINYLQTALCLQYQQCVASRGILNGPPKKLTEKIFSEFVTSSMSDCFTRCLHTDLCVGQDVLHLADNTYRCQLITLDTSQYSDVSSGVSDVSGCVSSPCMNQGHCVDRQGSYYVCKCVAPFYTGNRCEQPSPCTSDSCYNGGTCNTYISPTLGHFTCSCRRGYTGYQCETELPAVTFYSSGDNGQAIFADGVNVGTNGTDWQTTFAAPVRAPTQVVAALIYNAGGKGGFIGSSSDNLWNTDSSWKCVSSKPPSNWINIGFDDSNWPRATATLQNGADPWNSRLYIATTAYWIWAGDYDIFIPYAYCRKTISP